MRAIRRRTLVKATAAGAMTAPVTAAFGLARARAGADAGFRPAGWLRHRIGLTADRLLRGRTPSYDDDMVLADVRLDKPRRFSEFSGDLSGRYIEALAALPAGDSATRLPRLSREIIRAQRPDGRFGNTALAFTADAIGREHMALLWGNGRLLVGLLEAHRATSDPALLEAARKLGDFLLAVEAACTAPGVRAKMNGQGAHGFICFTQVVEGLALLGARTKDARYTRSGRQIAALLEPRGRQHSHGYLSTLRGAMLLTEAGRERALVADVARRFDELVASDDFMVYGGVPEYFGRDPKNSDRRDEGCSEADFLRLALQLWRSTGEARYLEHAERCLLNAFCFSQFDTGDFGHHTFTQRGTKPTDSVGRAWWCCTMHGYRAFKDVLDAAVTKTAGAVRVNLYLPGAWSDGQTSLSFAEAPAADADLGSIKLQMRVDAAGPVTLALRRPSWAESVDVRSNRAAAEVSDQDGYITLRRSPKRGDVIEVTLRARTVIETRDQKRLAPAELGERPIEGALHHGPWLLAADDQMDPLFFGEPWPRNVVYLPQRPTGRPPARLETPFAVRRARLALEYRHDGFPSKDATVLRPISEQTARDPGIVAFWLTLTRAPSA